MISSPPESLHELGQIVVNAAEAGDSQLKGSHGVRRPIQSKLIRDLILQRKKAQDMKTLQNIRNRIHKQSRKELRL